MAPTSEPSSSSSSLTPPNLFDYTEDELMIDNKLTHYEILNLPHHATPEQVKKSYRRTSLKYHPDKTGRDQEDYVFLAVKRAYDHLMDPVKRQSYDSTVLFFDDSIPAPREKLLSDPLLLYTDDDFYETFGAVFERNLRFDARLRPDIKNNNTNNNTKRKSFAHITQPPSLGTAETPMSQVHAFYEYWVHFESWRDFSAQAADELEMENDLENAESRYEKRWIQQQVDKRAKQLKKIELNRIQSLVERAMEADPRLRRERLEEKQAKEQAKLDRLAEQERAKQEVLRKQQQALEELEAEKLAKQQEKMEREQHKKELRKARQQLRRMSSSSFQEEDATTVYADLYDMEQDVEFLCTTLSLEELLALTKRVDGKQGEESLQLIKAHVEHVKTSAEEAAAAEQASVKEDAVTAKGTSSKETNPWTSQELSALAKGVKKYPGAGANRWDTICSYINTLCLQDIPRTKEECIEKFNQVARQTAKGDLLNSANDSKSSTVPAAATASSATATSNADDWSPEQDKQLQEGLAKYPATMDKNERWTSIAKAVSGKNKKDCVQRFKVIRDAIKNNK